MKMVVKICIIFEVAQMLVFLHAWLQIACSLSEISKKNSKKSGRVCPAVFARSSKSELVIHRRAGRLFGCLAAGQLNLGMVLGSGMAFEVLSS